MQQEEKKKIQAWVPVSIYNQIESIGFKSQNEAVNFAFVKLLEKQTNNQDESKMIQDESKMNQIESELNQSESSLINQLHMTLEEKEILITGLHDKNQSDSKLINELQVRQDEKEKLLQGLQDYNDTLKNELEKAERDKEDLKTTYNNYFLQVQTLINQKAIEAPGAKKPFWRFW
jgi:hypothetical protein